MAESGSMGDVIELSELRRLIDEPTVSQEGMPGDHGACECPDCGGDVLTFPPVELLPDDELAARVPAVPLVRDVRRLAGQELEQDRAGIHDPAHFAYPTYAKAAMQRR